MRVSGRMWSSGTGSWLIGLIGEVDIWSWRDGGKEEGMEGEREVYRK